MLQNFGWNLNSFMSSIKTVLLDFGQSQIKYYYSGLFKEKQLKSLDFLIDLVHVLVW